MAVFIVNSNNFNQDNRIYNRPLEQIPIQELDLATHIGLCLQKIPPKQLCRCLRESFLLRWEDLQLTTPDFRDLVTEMAILLARLDAEEDKQ